MLERRSICIASVCAGLSALTAQCLLQNLPFGLLCSLKSLMPMKLIRTFMNSRKRFGLLFRICRGLSWSSRWLQYAELNPEGVLQFFIAVLGLRPCCMHLRRANPIVQFRVSFPFPIIGILKFQNRFCKFCLPSSIDTRRNRPYVQGLNFGFWTVSSSLNFKYSIFIIISNYIKIFWKMISLFGQLSLDLAASDKLQNLCRLSNGYCSLSVQRSCGGFLKNFSVAASCEVYVRIWGLSVLRAAFSEVGAALEICISLELQLLAVLSVLILWDAEYFTRLRSNILGFFPWPLGGLLYGFG